jgi:adenylate cyclase
LAKLQASAVYQSLDANEAQSSAEALARQAVARDSADAEARSCQGWALQARGELEGALMEIDHALAISPNLAVAHAQRGATLIFIGRPKEGLRAIETSIRLDPRDPFSAIRLLHIACGLYFSGEYEATVEAAKRLSRSYPNFPMIHRWSAAALGQLGRKAEAKEDTHCLSTICFGKIFLFAQNSWVSEHLDYPWPKLSQPPFNESGP